MSHTVVIRKPGRPDYQVTKAYRPIALLDCLAKILSACVAEILTYESERLHLIPDTQFGGRPSHSTNDALHLLVSRIHAAWRRKNVVSSLFLDIKSAFPSVVPSRLIHELRARGIPEQITGWLKNRLTGRSTKLIFDDFSSDAININSGLDQGCPMSVILHHFSNAFLMDTTNEKKREFGSLFVDDTCIQAEAKTIDEAHRKLKRIMEKRNGILEGARKRNIVFELTKSAIVDFTRKRQKHPSLPNRTIPIARPPITIDGRVITPQKTYKFLGLILDQELRYKEHAAYATAKGTKWISQFRRLTKVTTGMPPRYARQLYLAVAVPRMLYAADVFCPPRVSIQADGTKKRKTAPIAKQLNRVQRAAAIQSLGALRTTATDILDAHANLLPIPQLIEKICSKSAIRIATLPSTHPVAQEAKKASRRLLKRNNSPLHFLMHAFPFHSSSLETISFIHPFSSPYSTPKLRYIIPQDKEAAAKAAENIKSGLVVYSDGSAIEEGVGAAAVTKVNGTYQALRYHLGSPEHHTVYEAELVGIALGLKHAQRRGERELCTICLDNQAAIRALSNPYPHPSHYIVDKILTMVKTITRTRTHLQIVIQWVPGHEGIEGNEKSDEEAKKAAKGDTSCQTELPTCLLRPLDISSSACNMTFLKELQEVAASTWKASPRYARVERVDPNLPSKKYLKRLASLTKSQASLLTQLRTHHIPLNAFLHRIRKHPTGKCPACNNEAEMVLHFLIACPRREHQQAIAFRPIRPRDRTLDAILGKAENTKALFKYIRITNRFANMPLEDKPNK